jgi:hypothetical protein
MRYAKVAENTTTFNFQLLLNFLCTNKFMAWKECARKPELV